MKRLIGILGALVAFGIPAAAQSQYPNDRDYDRSYAQQQPQAAMSPDDQREFNKEYDKWQSANARNDRSDIDKHARKMEEITARYYIPPSTPFNAIATSNGYAPRTNIRDLQGRFSPDDQKNFDKAYEHWLKDTRKHDRDDIARDENKMQEIMARYNIPRDVPYDAPASGGRGY
jgi:hypothetical protein